MLEWDGISFQSLETSISGTTLRKHGMEVTGVHCRVLRQGDYGVRKTGQFQLHLCQMI